MSLGVGRSRSAFVWERLLVNDSSNFTSDWTHDSSDLLLKSLLMLLLLDSSIWFIVYSDGCSGLGRMSTALWGWGCKIERPSFVVLCCRREEIEKGNSEGRNPRRLSNLI